MNVSELFDYCQGCADGLGIPADVLLSIVRAAHPGQPTRKAHVQATARALRRHGVKAALQTIALSEGA